MIAAATQGLSLQIYRFPLGDCSAGGISATAKGLALVGVEGLDKTLSPLPVHSRHAVPGPDYPPVILSIRRLGSENYAVLVPAVKSEGSYVVEPRWTMSSGNLASGDSRLNELVQSLGLPRFTAAYSIHDRIEHK